MIYYKIETWQHKYYRQLTPGKERGVIMTLSIGEIDPEIGNTIRSEIVRWCSEYHHTLPGRTFKELVVRVNKPSPNEPVCAVEVRVKLQIPSTSGSSDGGSLGDKQSLHIQRDILQFAETLKERFGVLLDDLEVGDQGRVQFGFLAPDNQRIPEEKCW